VGDSLPNRCLVTGATGFLGSRLVRRLLDHGLSVAALLRPGTDPWRIRDVLGRVEVIEGDLEDLRPARDPVSRFGAGGVFHLAWSGVTRPDRDDPARARTSVRGSIELARAVLDGGCRILVGLGSQAEYGRPSSVLDEALVPAPDTPYGKAKVEVHEAFQALAASAGCRLAWLRLLTAYGPMDDDRYLVPYVIRTLLRGQVPELTGGSQRWDFLYVDDVAEALVATAASAHASGTFVLCSSTGHPVREVAERIRDLVDPSLPLGFGKIAHDPQARDLVGDGSRLRAATGWEPRVGLADGLARTVAWYRASTCGRGG
jgi:nucleoside-diphosphate-sugar epimerase